MLKFRFLYFIVLFYLSVFTLSASNPDRILTASRINEEIKMDGVLDENAWKNAHPATDFIQTEPTPGLPATFSTEAFFLYDNNAVYIGARMLDPEPHKILKELSLRDQMGNADYFGVFFDTYKSGINGFNFFLTASGVQKEGVVTNHKDDSNWNAVWESAVTQDDKGWYVEIKIPYSSLRFPSVDVQEWNVQFAREIRRFRETSYWSPIDPTISGWVQQSGSVTGIKNIKSPVRLSLTPYVSGYINTTYDPLASQKKLSTGTAYSAGLDLKYGINDAFTLDMTLIPDFGQVISDRQVLNLSPFEVFFEENRQFFTEGTELFNRGRLFYSRRIGGRPLNYGKVESQLKEGETIINNPETSQLFNATKVSGRTATGLGIGGFNALVGEEFAIVRASNGSEREIRTNPMTNYNVLVLDQNLKNNSYVSLVNTNVYRLGSDYDANATGGFFNIRTQNQKYMVSGSGVVANQFYTDRTQKGFTYNLEMGKISGNWTYSLAHGIESDKYNPNDLGFIFSPNEVYYFGSGGYTQYKPKNEKFQQFNIRGAVNYTRLYKPSVYNDFFITLNSFFLYKSRNAFGINARIEPFETRDYFEPRTADFSKFVAWSPNYMLGGFISTDYRKPFAFDVNANYRYFDAPQRRNISASFSPRVRFSDRLSVFSSVALSSIKFEPGYVNKTIDGRPIEGLSADDILVGHRNRIIIDHSLTGRFIFNSIMGVNVRIRHYWDKVRYQEFGALNDKGYLDLLRYNGINENGDALFDRNVNIFNVDLQYNWRFAPGSDIIFVWKNQILNNDKEYQRDYFSNLGGLFDSFQTNSFSVRVLYFLDYLQVFPRKEV
jgi:hypothetical protein